MKEKQQSAIETQRGLTHEHMIAKAKILSMGVSYLEMCNLISSSKIYWDAWQTHPVDFLTHGYIDESNGVFWRGCGMAIPKGTIVRLRKDYVYPILYVVKRELTESEKKEEEASKQKTIDASNAKKNGTEAKSGEKDENERPYSGNYNLDPRWLNPGEAIALQEATQEIRVNNAELKPWPAKEKNKFENKDILNFPKVLEDEWTVIQTKDKEWAIYQHYLTTFRNVDFYLEMPDWVARYDQLFAIGTQDNPHAIVLSCS